MGFWTPLATMTASRVRGIVGVSQEFEPWAKAAEGCGISHGGYPALRRSITRRYGQFGMVEEISAAEIRAQLETNLLGALWVTQAAQARGIATTDYESRLATWREWQPVAAAAQGTRD
jgi:NAD(P)-dependent dehydrogenase (short-subunit alcohol dehydrogenase family)